MRLGGDLFIILSYLIQCRLLIMPPTPAYPSVLMVEAGWWSLCHPLRAYSMPRAGWRKEKGLAFITHLGDGLNLYTIERHSFMHLTNFVGCWTLWYLYGGEGWGTLNWREWLLLHVSHGLQTRMRNERRARRGRKRRGFQPPLT